MAQQVSTKRGEVAPEKTQVQWRVSLKVLNALQADADRQGFSSIPVYLNHMLTLHYFGKQQLEWNGERINVDTDKTPCNWRMLKRVLSQLKADADQWNMTVPRLVNQMLFHHYFGRQGDRKS